MRYYRSRHLLEDYEPVPDWDSDWESPSEDSDYEAKNDIDGPDHTEDYLDWWRGHHPHHIGIHDADLGDDAGEVEDAKET